MPSLDPILFIPLQLFVLAMAVLFALLEIQVEGAHGWASALPTWRIETPFLTRLLHGKPLTGYHVYLTLFLFLLFHFPVLLFGWSWELELTILLSHATLTVFEDFLWFILNPYYGWQRFSDQYVWWFSSWWGAFPVDYYFWFVVAATCAGLRGLSSHSVHLLSQMSAPAQNLIFWFAGLLLCIAIIALMVRYIQPKARIHSYSKHHTHRRGRQDINMLESV